MSAKGCKRKRFTTAPQSLYVQRLAISAKDDLRNEKFYQTRSGAIYTFDCKEESPPTKTHKSVYTKMMNKYENLGPCINLRPLKMTRGTDEPKAFHLPPNIYDVAKIPYESQKGLGGAYWAKLHPRAIQSRIEEDTEFYDLPRETERLTHRSNSHKGKFSSNARAQRPTTRCMITDPVLVYRDPLRPSPVHYDLQHHTIAYNVGPRKYTKKPNPHLFLRRSSIPEKVLSYIPRHQSFKPAVGRYETRERNYCCSYCKKNDKPALSDLSHVQGGGYKRLFRLPAAHFRKLMRRHGKRLVEKKLDLTLKRDYISKRSQKLPYISSPLRFHCNIVPRRFINPLRRMSIFSALQRLKTSRRVEPRISKEPARKLTETNVLYKPNFKFLPLPAPRILIKKENILLNVEPPRFYNYNIDVNQFLKKKENMN